MVINRSTQQLDVLSHAYLTTPTINKMAARMSQQMSKDRNVLLKIHEDRCGDYICNEYILQDCSNKTLRHECRIKRMDYDDNTKIFPEVGVGLQNLRNNCFANAIVQSLIHCPDFHRHLMSQRKWYATLTDLPIVH